MLHIVKMTTDGRNGTRYSVELERTVNELGGVEVIFLDFCADYQGHADIDVLLKDGRVFSYKYWYGSCSGCDEWEYRELSEEDIVAEMKQSATYFDNREQYNKWAEVGRKQEEDE